MQASAEACMHFRTYCCFIKHIYLVHDHRMQEPYNVISARKNLNPIDNRPNNSVKNKVAVFTPQKNLNKEKEILRDF